jgi:coenzyme PQQ precursor peptide PqqA
MVRSVLHENHETPFMIPRYVRPAAGGDDGGGDRALVMRRHGMKWETPEAIDMRFGMEITMYISNR